MQTTALVNVKKKEEKRAEQKGGEGGLAFSRFLSMDSSMVDSSQ